MKLFAILLCVTTALILNVKGSVQGPHFYLYTKNTKTQPEELIASTPSSLTGSHFLANKPVKILCHGFTSNYQAAFPQDLKNTYVNLATDINVIAVDWAALSSALVGYTQAAQNTEVVGQQIALLVNALVSGNLASVSNFHFIGHSLGGQVGAFISSGLPNSAKLPRVTGLDPARPGFDTAPPAQRLDATDADFVDVIHTSAGGVFSTSRVADPAIGTVDFYPNGGVQQAGCGTILGEYPKICSHSRAYLFYQESVTNPAGFRACKCAAYAGCQLTGCSTADTAYMGAGVSTSVTGTYFLNTAASAPYALG